MSVTGDRRTGEPLVGSMQIRLGDGDGLAQLSTRRGKDAKKSRQARPQAGCVVITSLMTREIIEPSGVYSLSR